MLQPFEKGRSLVDQAVPVAQLLQKISGALKEVEELRKKVSEKT